MYYLKNTESHLQFKSLCGYFSLFQIDTDGSVRLSVHEINEWFENDHMLSPLGDAQHTEVTTAQPPRSRVSLCSHHSCTANTNARRQHHPSLCEQMTVDVQAYLTITVFALITSIIQEERN